MAVEQPADVVARLRSTFQRGVTKPLAWRLAQLEGLGQLLVEQRGALEDALRSDLGKAPTESFVTEVGFLQQEVKHTLRHLADWLRPQRAPVPLQLAPGRAETVLEPLGVALVIAPWNYPVMLALSPVIGALAAGDTVVLKPSELAPATSALLADLLPRHLDARAVAVVEGGVDETTALLAERFDTIFFTGSTRVGRVVAEAAAKHLTPTTLELGGKSPVWVDASADLDVTASRLAWGKFVNAGQTCVAPDYVLATPATARELLPRVASAVARMYPGALDNDDYCRILNEHQFDRLEPLLESGRTAFGGGSDRARLKIEPTGLAGVSPDDPVMQQEIFGPILPVVEVADEAEAIAHVNAGPKPLAAYVFTRDAGQRRRWTRETSSGSVVFDLALAQLAVPGIPFGGVGASGTGDYHGRRSVLAFSHEKAVFAKPTRPDTIRLLMPPYTAARRRLLDRILR